MSSYISSQYSIERQRRRAIVQQCNQELQQAIHAAAENRAQWNAMLEARKRTQEQLRRREQLAADEADAQALRVKVQRKMRDEETKQLLETAVERVSDCQKLGQSEDLVEQLRTMQQGFSMFGSSDQLQMQVQYFIAEEIPRYRQQLMQDAEKRQSKEAFQAFQALHANCKDHSAQFISMQIGQADTPEFYVSPWKQFVQRLRAVCNNQLPLGDTRGQDLLEQALQVDEAQRNRFLLHHEATVKQIEEELASITLYQDQCTEWRDTLYNRYLALCMLCDIYPSPLDEISDMELEHTTETLFAQYQKQKERQYINNAFSQVLDHFGIAFESMDTDEYGQLQMKYHISDRAHLHITRSDTGSFEMQFSGVSDGETASIDEKRQIVEQAHLFCQKLPQVAKALEERGILFHQVAMQQPTEENIHIVSHCRESRFRTVEKAREMR